MHVMLVPYSLPSGTSSAAGQLGADPGSATDYLYETWSGQRTGPTARTGAPRVGAGRNRSPLLTHGPVQSEDGNDYLVEVT